MQLRARAMCISMDQVSAYPPARTEPAPLVISNPCIARLAEDNQHLQVSNAQLVEANYVLTDINEVRVWSEVLIAVPNIVQQLFSDAFCKAWFTRNWQKISIEYCPLYTDIAQIWCALASEWQRIEADFLSLPTSVECCELSNFALLHFEGAPSFTDHHHCRSSLKLLSNIVHAWLTTLGAEDEGSEARAVSAGEGQDASAASSQAGA